MISKFHAKYFACELTKRCSADSLEKLTSSLMDAQVDLNPHQIEASLFAFKSPLSRGAVLADEVGLGKTIEAGLVLSQRWAERKRKILIIVPSSLRKQWNQELLDKFFIPSIILESRTFNQYVKEGKRNPFLQDVAVICSYNFARSKEDFIKAITWDIVVIDEAHRLRNVYKPSNVIARSIQNAVEHRPKLLLTATPLQNSLLELYGLVSFVDEYSFGDVKSFKNQFVRLTNENDFSELKSRLSPICIRTLRRQVLEYISYTNRIPITQEFVPTEEEHILYEMVSEYLRRPSLQALPASQRSLMILVLRKLLASSTFAIAGALNSLVTKLKAKLKKAESTSTLQDDLSEDYETLDEIEEEWEGEEETMFTQEDIEAIRQEIKELDAFRDLAVSITDNAKGKALLAALKTGFAKLEELGANKKAVVFTESRKTQAYLLNLLSDNGYADSIVLFNGTNSDPKSKEIYKLWYEKHQGTDRVTGSRTADTRAALVEYFKNDAVILIATEAAAEGINLQFCSHVVNYDLPWNPQRIEQRIGRCHRYGQKFDVVVVNFLNKKNAADQRVYELLKDKFKLFEGVFGASDEVLGTIESGVDFEKRIVEIYQTCRTEEEIQASFNALQQAMETDIDEKLATTRQQLLENFDEEVVEKLRVNLRESREYLNKHEQWLWEITKYYLDPYADYTADGRSFYLKRNPFPSETIHPGPYRMEKNVEDANIYRIGHPLAQRIIESCKQQELPSCELIFDYMKSPTKITILEPLIGKSGWLTVLNFTLDSFEVEDYILFSGMCDDGMVLDTDQCRRLFSLPATEKSLPSGIDTPARKRLDDILSHYEQETLQSNMERNTIFFESEMEKLEKWADDQKSSLEIELKQLDQDIKAHKTEAKKIPVLAEKVNAQREIKELEKKRNHLRQTLFNAQDDVDTKKESLLGEIETRLKQRISRETLFTVRWEIV